MARANVTITLENKQFIAAAMQAGGAWGGLQAKLSIGIEDQLKNIDRFDQRWNAGLGRIQKSMINFGQTAFMYVTLPIAGISTAAFKAYGDIEALELGMQSLEPTIEMAKVRLQELFQMSKAPGGAFEEVVQADLLLRNTGLSAEMATRTTKGFMNALALVGKGKVDFYWITKALSQISARGLVQGDEINQLSERLPQIKKLLKDAFGTADTEVLKKMGVSSDDFFNRIIPLLEKMPKAMGGFRNATDNVVDGLKIFGASIGEMFDKGLGLTEKLNWATDALTNMAGVIDGLPSPIKTVISSVVALGAAFPVVVMGAGALLSVNNFFMQSLVMLKPLLDWYRASLISINVIAGLSIGSWIALAAGVALVAKSLYDYNNRFNETEFLAKENANVQAEQIKLYGEQSIRLEQLLKTAQNERLEMAARKDALKQYNDAMVDTNDKLKIEEVNTDKATKSWMRYSAMLKIATEIKARFNIVQSLQEKLVKAESEQATDMFSQADWIDKILYGSNAGMLAAKSQQNLTKLKGQITKSVDSILSSIPDLFKKGESFSSQFYESFFGTKEMGAFKGSGAGKGVAERVYEGIREELKSINSLDFKGKLNLNIPEQKGLYDAIKNSLIGGLEVGKDDYLIQKFYEKLLKIEDPQKIIDEVLDPDFSKRLGEKMAEKISNIKVTAKVDLSNTITQMNPYGDGTSSDAMTFKLLKSIGLDDSTIDNVMRKGNENLRKLYLELALSVQEFKESLPTQLTYMATDLATGFAEIVGSVFAGEQAFKNAGRSLIQSLGGMIKNIGQKILEIYIQKVLLEKAVAAINNSKFIGGLTGGTMLGGGLIGLGLVALSALFSGISSRSSSSKRQFASGATLFGKTEFVGGEYAGASSNPEVVAPLDRITALMGNKGGGFGGVLETRVAGEDLVILLKRAEKRINSR